MAAIIETSMEHLWKIVNRAQWTEVRIIRKESSLPSGVGAHTRGQHRVIED